VQTKKTISVYGLALCAAVLAASNSVQAAIESNFDDGVYPGVAGNGWVDGWQNTIGAPIFRTNEPLPSLTGTTPYIHLNAAGNTTRNFMRQMENGGGVNLAIPHYIRWKFRLAETNFVANFTASGDRVHFFGRNGARLGASTDASVNWMIYCSGAIGAVGGEKMFWLCDNWNGSGAFDANTATNTGVPLVPFHIYAFEVYVIPEQQAFKLSIVDESTNNASFTSSVPHKFRNLSAAPDSFTYLHFGTQASSSSEVRPFDLDSVSITPWAGPIVVDLVPESGAVHWASNGIQFTVRAEAAIDVSGIKLLLNSNDVTSQLVITGDPTNRLVSFAGLTPNLKYKMEITASNSAGPSTLTSFFYTPESSKVTLFDVGGFTDDVLYPVGYLAAVTNKDYWWAPAAAPNSGEIVDLDDGRYEKVLRRQQLGGSYHDYVMFPPVSSGVVEIELDARVPAMTGRVIDLSLNSPTAAGGGTQGPFIMWATNALYYFDRVLDSWVPQTNLDNGWHHFKLTCYVSGPLGNTFDLEVDNAPVSKGLLWRSLSAITVGTLRIGTLNTGAVPGEYGEVDNLVLKVSPEPLVALPVRLLSPTCSGSTFSLSFASLSGINYLVQSIDTLTSTAWTTLRTNAGDGSVQTVTLTNPPASGVFYRVESRLP
jgi:hypothetical protein